jgi:uncharacterized protein
MLSSEIEKIKHYILEFFKDQEVGVFLFGSRAGGRHHQGSDLDIGVFPNGKYEPFRLILLRNLLENFNNPFKIDLVDFSNVSDSFKIEALKEAIWWRDLD